MELTFSKTANSVQELTSEENVLLLERNVLSVNKRTILNRAVSKSLQKVHLRRLMKLIRTHLTLNLHMTATSMSILSKPRSLSLNLVK